jgi:hypothetical protein
MRRQPTMNGLAAIGLGAALTFAVALVPDRALAACGDGIVDGTEECDYLAGDPNAECCSASCTFIDQGVSCDDGEICTVNTKCDGTGECAGGQSAPSSTECHQAGECGVRTCMNKACAGPEVSNICNDANPCTLDICANPGAYPDAGTACTHANFVYGTDCSGGSQQCDTSICDGTGACVPGLAPSGAGCDTDASACTHEECDGAGSCDLISTEDCSSQADPGVCKFWQCNTTTAVCEKKNKSQGTACTDDGKDCTQDECGTSGRCRHTSVQAGTICYEDTNSCSTELCNAKGKCSYGSAYPTIYRSHGSPCDDPNTAAVEGDDGSVCTIDYCKNQGDGTTACAHEGTISGTTTTTNGDACTDFNPCTDSSACSNGACAGTSCTAVPTDCPFVSCGDPTPCSATLPSCGCSG